MTLIEMKIVRVFIFLLATLTPILAYAKPLIDLGS
jgi:hypothetical protein